MAYEIVIGIVMSILSIFIYAKALNYLLKRIRVKTTFKKDLLYSFILFIPISIAVFLITIYEINQIWNTLLLIALIIGIIFPLKCIYKLKWKIALMVSVMWFIAILFIGLILNIITGLILSA